MSLYWHAGFEANDLSEVEYLERASSSTGWGVPDPKNVITVVPNPKFNGQYVASCKMLTATPAASWSYAHLKQWTGIRTLAEVYLGTALYIPSATLDVPTTGWAKLVGMGEVGAPYRGFASLFIGRQANGNLIMVFSNDFAGYAELSPPMSVPLDRWFTVVMYYRGGISGNIKCWIDGAQVADWSADLSSSASIGPEISAGIGGSDLPAGIEVLVDEMKAASTYELALPVPSVIPPPPLQHTLSITTVPSGISFTLVKL